MLFRSTRVLYVLLAAVTLLATGFICFAAYTALSGDANTIIRTEDGFRPDMTHIDVGETITFVNKTDTAMWPAANSHPTHNSLKAFDPKTPIEPGASWSFTFEEPGKWGFHDHLTPGHRGIVFAGSEAEMTNSCDDPDVGTGYRLYCWGVIATNIVEDEGFNAVFDWFAKKYESDKTFRDNCHDVTHVIGEVAYEAYENDHKTITRPETSYCGYGFYHGFIEVALVSYGQQYEEKAKEYCDAIGRSDSFESRFAAETAMAACDHGIGHAVFDSINSDSWGKALEMLQIGFDVCTRMFSDNEWRRISCGSGVSNALAKAHSHSQYYFEPSREDPTGVCKELSYEFRRNCYMELGLPFAKNMNYSTEEVIEYMKGFEDDEITSWSILAYIDDKIRYDAAIDRLPEIHETCNSLTKEILAKGCIKGVMIGLRAGGNPGEEHKKMVEFCELFKKESGRYGHCTDEMFSKLLGIYSQEKFALLCNELQEKNLSEHQKCREYVQSFGNTQSMDG